MAQLQIFAIKSKATQKHKKRRDSQFQGVYRPSNPSQLQLPRTNRNCPWRFRNTFFSNIRKYFPVITVPIHLFAAEIPSSGWLTL